MGHLRQEYWSGLPFPSSTFDRGHSQIQIFKRKVDWDFPDGPVIKTLSCQHRGHGFDPWLGKKHPTCDSALKKNKGCLGDKDSGFILNPA